MNGGDPVVGGNQVTPGGTRPVTPGSQPAGVDAAAASNSSTDLTIPHDSPAPAAPTPMAPAAPSAPAADADFSSLHSEPVSSPTPPVVPTPSSPTSTASLVNPLASTPVTPPQSPSPLGMSTPNITSGSPSAAPAGMGPGAPMSSTPMRNNFGQGPLTQSGFSQNPFSGGVYTPPVYSQSGDIILGGDTTPTKKSKAKAVLAVLAILIVVAGVVWAVVSSFGGLMGGSNSTANDTKTLLNTYSNYLLYGTESSDPISNSATWSTETIDTNLVNTDEETKATYFSTVLSLYSNFSASYSDNTQFKESLAENDSVLLENLVSDTATALEALQIYSTIPSFSTDDMITYYLSKGGDNLLSYADNLYGAYFDSTNQTINNYASTKVTTASLVVELYDKYKAQGCIEGQSLNQECINNANNDENIHNSSNSLSSYAALSSSAEKHIIKDPVSSSRMIYEIYYPQEEVND